MSIYDNFNKYFETVHANSGELRREVYKLRYQEFCIENKFLNPNDYPDNLEYDKWDTWADHYLIRHRRSGEYAAATRLILPNNDNIDQLLPLEEYFDIDNLDVMGSIDRRHLGETSRLLVSKTFKRGKSDAKDYFDKKERLTFQYLSFGLIACLVKSCYENDISHFFGTLEPAWFRYLSSSGINFTKIGPLMDFHGERWPGVIKVTDLLDGVWEKNKEMWDFLTDHGKYSQISKEV